MQAHFLCIANTLRVICITCKHRSSANSESTLFSTTFRDAAAGCSRLHYAIIHYEGGDTLSSAGSPQACDRLCISSHHHNAAMWFLHWLYSTVTVSLVHHVQYSRLFNSALVRSMKEVAPSNFGCCWFCNSSIWRWISPR